MDEEIKWDDIAVCLLNLLDRCESGSTEEVSYPVAANIFNVIEMALSVLRYLEQTDINDRERQLFFSELCQCFGEIHRHWWEQMVEIGRRTTALVNLGNQGTGSRGRGRLSRQSFLKIFVGLVARGPTLHECSMCPDGQSAGV